MPAPICARTTYVGATEVVNGDLAQHGVVLELRLAERRSVASNEDELGLAGAEGLEGLLVSQHDATRLDNKSKLATRGLDHCQSKTFWMQISIPVDGVLVLLRLLNGSHCE